MKNKINNIKLDRIFIIIGIILMLYYICLKIVFGNVAFSGMFFISGFILFSYGTIEKKFGINIWKSIPKQITNIITILFVVGLSIFTIVEGMIIYEGHHKDNKSTDYLMVLGAGLRGDKVSRSLKYRLDTAIEFNEKNPNVKIIVSGGQGSGEDITEALAMKNYLVSNGVDEDLIIEEDKSTSTYENFLFTKNLLKEEFGEGDYILTVVTNNFHMYRAKYLGKQVGFKCLGYPAPSDISTTLNFHIREFFGVMKAYIFNR